MYHPVPYRSLLHWLLFTGLIVFFTGLLWDSGALLRMLSGDVTRITSLTLLVYLAACGHCGYRSWWLSREFVAFDQLVEQTRQGRAMVLDSTHLAVCYFRALGPDQAENAIAAEVMAERAKGAHQVGWFVTGLLVKFGLLGTVIGFILMLGSVSGLENLDTSDIKELMQKMTDGMGVAMNTTLVGLVCSMLLGLQYLMLDREADKLVVETLTLGQLLDEHSPEPR